MQIKNHKYHFPPTRMTEIKRDSVYWHRCRKIRTLYTAARNGKWCRHFEKQPDSSLKCENTNSMYDPAILLLRELKTYIHIKTGT